MVRTRHLHFQQTVLAAPQKEVLHYIIFQFLWLKSWSEPKFSRWILPGECRDAADRPWVLSWRRSISPQRLENFSRELILANPLRSALQKCTLCTWLAPSLWLHTEEDSGVWGRSLWTNARHLPSRAKLECHYRKGTTAEEPPPTGVSASSRLPRLLFST